MRSATTSEFINEQKSQLILFSLKFIKTQVFQQSNISVSRSLIIMRILQLHIYIKFLRFIFLFDSERVQKSDLSRTYVIMLRIGRFFNRARNEVMICGPKVARHEDASTGGIGVAGRLEITWHIIAKH